MRSGARFLAGARTVRLVVSAMPSDFAAAQIVAAEDRAVVAVAYGLAAVTAGIGLAIGV